MSKPLQYRRKPAFVEAMRLYGDKQDMDEVARWCGGRIRSEAKASDHTDLAYWIDIPTLEGVMTAGRGDYVVKDAQGGFHSIKPDVFEAAYERVGMRGQQ